jgi:molybdate transport system substrate-binding protein
MRGRLRALAFGIGLLGVTNMAQAAEVRAFVTGAARPMFDLLAPQFERSTGHKLITTSALPPQLVAKVEAGEPFDVIVLSYDVEALIKKGLLDPSSRTVLGQIGIGVAIHTGSPKPDFSTVEKFKQMLLNAKSIATSGEGSSGRYVDSLIERLGIADQVRPKIKSGGPGASAKMLSNGEVDFVVSGLPPLLGQPEHRMARIASVRNQQLPGVQRGTQHARKGARGWPGAAPPSRIARGNGGLQVQGARPGALTPVP